MTSTNRTAVLFDFHEAEARPRDSAAGLSDLVVPSTLVEPSSVPAYAGLGRQFGIGHGYTATEQTAGQTKLKRTMAIEAIVNFTRGSSSDGDYVIVARGIKGSAAERILYGLKLVTSSGLTYLQMFWQEGDGTTATVPSLLFSVPTSNGGFFYVAAVRRWTDVATVAVDYYLNGELLGTVSSSDGDIDNGDAGTTSVGMLSDGAAGWESFFRDIINRLRITNGERTAEEIRQTYRRTFVYPGQAYELVKAFLPVGEPYSTDPDSAVQRELAIEGDSLGHAWSLAEELADDFLPDRATKTLARWESILRLSPAPTDTIAKRRKRVLGFLRKIHGYSRTEILNTLEILVDLDPADIELLENSNRFADAFPGTTLGKAWFVEALDGAVTTPGNVVELAYSTGHDARWESGLRKAISIRSSIVGSDSAGGAQDEIIANIAAMSVPTSGCMAGLFVLDGVTGDAHLFGFRNAGIETDMAHVIHRSGVMGPPTYMGSSVGTQAYLRMKLNVDKTVTLSWCNNLGGGGFEGPWTDLAVGVSTIDAPSWAGVFVMSEGASAAAGGSMNVDEIRIWKPRSRDVYKWFIYSDPGLGGSPDIAGAQLVVNKVKPAHTDGRVIESKAFIVGDPYSLVGRDRLGA